jgi:hypothetical protein
VFRRLFQVGNLDTYLSSEHLEARLRLHLLISDTFHLWLRISLLVINMGLGVNKQLVHLTAQVILETTVLVFQLLRRLLSVKHRLSLVLLVNGKGAILRGDQQAVLRGKAPRMLMPPCVSIWTLEAAAGYGMRGIEWMRLEITPLVFEEVVQGATWGETLVLIMRGLRSLKQGQERRVKLDLTHGLKPK